MQNLTPPSRSNFAFYCIYLTRFLFILLWVYAAVNKMLDFQTFRVQLAQSPLLTGFENYVAYAVPAIELLLALLLTIERTKLIGLYGSFTLMAMFSVYIIAITNFSDYVPCSCGGILEDMSWNQHLVFNLLFVALAAASIIFVTLTGNYSLQRIRDSRKPVE